MPETSLLDESIAKLEALKRKRTSLKARITRIQNFVSNFQSNDNDVSPLETRKTFIEQIFKEYDEVQTEIESLDLSSEAIETQTQDRDEIDLKYLDVLSSIQTKIRQTTPPPHTAATANPNGSCSSANSHCSNRDQSIKLNLPTLNLKSFTGCYKEWLSFQNSFKSIIEDENNMLNNCQRFQYLRSCLSGEALRAVESLTVSSENYNVAWDILKKRFCNKRLIVHDHIIAITKAPQVIKASHSSLRCFLDTLNSNVAALRQLEVPIDTWHALLVVIIVDKLDDNLAREWQATLTDEVPTYGQTIEFLEKKCQLLESLNLLHPKSNVNPNHNNAKNNMSQKRSTTSYVATNKLHCTFCKNDDHTIFQCNEFTKLNVEERNAQARNLKLCLNCLRTNHFVNNCQSKFKCRKCNQSHNTLLHKERQITQTNETPAQVESLNAHSMRSQSSIILLSTAIVLIEDRNNKSHKCRALLDAGSMNSYITSSFSKKLRLQQKAVNITVGGIGQISTNIKQAVQVNIKSQYNKFSANLSCFVLEKITENLPLVTINMSAINIPKELQLADPKFLETAPIDLLIGADLFWNLLCQDRKEITLKNHNKLMLQNTHLGFIAGGSLNMNNNNSSSTCSLSLTSVTDILENQVQKFFELEQCSNPSEQKCFSNEEIMCEQHFIQNTCRQTNGKFLVKLPLKNDPPILKSNRDSAVKFFNNLERNLNKRPTLKSDYVQFMRDYISLGHMEEVPGCELNKPNCTYLPHHAVLKDSTSTKLRVVFNASFRSADALSLNDNLMAGPTIQPELFAILLRFRTFKYVVNGDIAKMYRMIEIHPDHSDYQRIVWRENTEDPLKTYRLTTLTYGTKPASFLATRCLKELALQNVNQYPEAAKAIQQDFYVDDLLTGGDSLENLITLRDQIIQILAHGGFLLRKWAANHPALIPDSHEPNLNVSFDKDAYTKTLGLFWNPNHDSLRYQVKQCDIPKRLTKREILSKTAQVFDPLGLVAPVVVKAKIILQQCWSLKIGWDDLLPETIYCAWVKILQELAHLNEIEIPRNIIKSSPVQVQLHGFGDASQIAYGAAVYLRTTDHSGNHQVHLICAKSRVAPLRAVTLPRLELCAALTLSRLFNTVLRTINVKIDQQFLWTDSTVVLAWINATSSNLQTFVGNRVSEIQTLTDAKDWYHVKSESNPADVLSRGALPGQLKTNKLWWNGPDWLSENNDTWPVSNVNLSDIEIPERRTVTLTNIHSRERQLPLLTKFSNYKKTERVMSWVLRFINNCRKPNQRQISSSLTCEELKDSMKAIMRLIQEVAFNDELACLKQNKPINKKSRLLCLNIFLDKNDNLIRAGGRLQNSSLTYDVKHPIVLPNDHHLIEALVKHVHIEQLHAGVQGTLAALRQNFWIISPRSVVRKILHQCLQCFKVKPSVMYPIMGNLPKSRVEPTRPFSISGVDYAGPIYIKECRGRSKRTVKAYICVFVCFSTKAVHLELVGDLTTQTFLNALKRFISRRGHVYHLYSDNATNFVGANRELLELRTFLKSASFSQITENLANKGISWHFIPPRSPHMGGIWEINVKSIKGHLKRTIGEVVLSYEELYTLLTRIEAVLNSRPLCPLSNDPNDLNPITPGHFLIGEPLTSISERDLTTTRINRLTQWQRVEQMRQHFWHRWQREYLVQNINRSKQLRGSGSRPSTPALEVGSMVILVEDNTPPLQWKLGRIVELHPGSDGVVRVVSVKTVNGIFKRATRKVCVLPANE
jgi:hypothetical protein